MSFFNRGSTYNRVVEKSEPHPRAYRKLMSGGLAGFSGVCVVQLLGLSNLDLSLKMALCSFGLAIPLLVKDLLDAQAEERHEIMINSASRLDATGYGLVFSLIGIGLVFWHFAWWILLPFAASCLWSLWSHLSYLGDLSKETKQ